MDKGWFGHLLLSQQLSLREPEEPQQVLPDCDFQHRVSAHQRRRVHSLPLPIHLFYDDGKIFNYLQLIYIINIYLFLWVMLSWKITKKNLISFSIVILNISVITYTNQQMEMLLHLVLRIPFNNIIKFD